MPVQSVARTTPSVVLSRVDAYTELWSGALTVVGIRSISFWPRFGATTCSGHRQPLDPSHSPKTDTRSIVVLIHSLRLIMLATRVLDSRPNGKINSADTKVVVADLDPRRSLKLFKTVYFPISAKNGWLVKYTLSSTWYIPLLLL